MTPNLKSFPVLIKCDLRFKKSFSNRSEILCLSILLIIFKLCHSMYYGIYYFWCHLTNSWTKLTIDRDI
jgi:hypothetical protein